MSLDLLTVMELLGLGFFAGTLGALVGIGGGVIIIPFLVLGFGIDIKVAVATSLVAVVATSTAAGSVYVGKGLSNMRLGMTLEIATTLGGISGGLLAVLIPASVLSGLFAVMMVVTAVLMARGRESHSSRPAPASASSGAPEPGAVRQDARPVTAGPAEKEPEGREEIGKLAGSYFDPYQREMIHYKVSRLPLGAAVSLCAGILSGMLGVGGGFIKVPAMTLGMGVPIKVAAATSNFMIGVTAISSLFVYLARGLVHPFIAAPIALGVTGGALGGTYWAKYVSPRSLQLVLAAVLVIVSVQMGLKAWGVTLVGK